MFGTRFNLISKGVSMGKKMIYKHKMKRINVSGNGVNINEYINNLRLETKSFIREENLPLNTKIIFYYPSHLAANYETTETDSEYQTRIKRSKSAKKGWKTRRLNEKRKIVRQAQELEKQERVQLTDLIKKYGVPNGN